MPRVLSPVLVDEKNQIESADPFCWLFQLDDPGNFPVPVRFGSDVDIITFHGNVHDPFPLTFDNLSETSLAERQNARVIIADVDRQIISLLETRWRGVVLPAWTLTVWRVLVSAPNETPFASGIFFEVLGVQVDFFIASFELQNARLPTRALETGRRWTRSQFPLIPRTLQ